MKHNITLALDERLLQAARALAAQRRSSVSAMLAQELKALVDRERACQRAKVRALAQLEAPFRLGGARITNREALHDRQGLR